MKIVRAVLTLCLAYSFGFARGTEPETDHELDADVESRPNPAFEVRFEARKKFQSSKQELESDYRKGLAEAVILADEIRVYLLDFEPVREIPKDQPGEYFPIRPYGAYSKILGTKKLEGEDTAACGRLVSELLRSPDVAGPFCHFPIHGIRLYRNGDLFFESSICWHCSNYYVEYPDDYNTATWVGFADQRLEAFLKEKLPIPPSEIERFNRKHKPDRTKPEAASSEP